MVCRQPGMTGVIVKSLFWCNLGQKDVSELRGGSKQNCPSIIYGWGKYIEIIPNAIAVCNFKMVRDKGSSLPEEP